MSAASKPTFERYLTITGGRPHFILNCALVQGHVSCLYCQHLQGYQVIFHREPVSLVIPDRLCVLIERHGERGGARDLALQHHLRTFHHIFGLHATHKQWRLWKRTAGVSARYTGPHKSDPLDFHCEVENACPE